jgi:hypothetical protein
MEHWWNDTDRGKLKYFEKNTCNATLSTTNTIWFGLGLKPGLHDDRLVCQNRRCYRSEGVAALHTSIALPLKKGTPLSVAF